MRYQYSYNGETFTIDLQPGPDDTYTAIIGDEILTVKARSLPGGGWRVTINGETNTAFSASAGSTRYVALNGETYTLAVPDERTRRRVPAGGDLTAQMPGQVTAVLVSEGDTVEQGQTLMILEAMKMELRVTAPAAGIVKRLLAAPGTVVERGQTLAEIEPTASIHA